MEITPRDENGDARTRKYDAWLQWSLTEFCNLSCEYCFTPATKDTDNAPRAGIFVSLRRAIAGLVGKEGSESPRDITTGARTAKRPERIDIPSLLTTLEKTGKIFRIGFSGGGEPFLVPNLIEACAALTEKHYISLNTNLTSPKIVDFAGVIDPARVVHFHASLHIKELERWNLLDRYIRNFLLCRERGFDLFAGVVAHPTLATDIAKYREYFGNRGIELVFSPFIGGYGGRTYPGAYTAREIELFELVATLNSDIVGFYRQKGEWCNAGYNAALVSEDGTVQVCSPIKETIGHIYRGLEFKKTLIRCPVEFCGCPLKNYDPRLFKIARRRSR